MLHTIRCRSRAPGVASRGSSWQTVPTLTAIRNLISEPRERAGPALHLPKKPSDQFGTLRVLCTWQRRPRISFGILRVYYDWVEACDSFRVAMPRNKAIYSLFYRPIPVVAVIDKSAGSPGAIS